MCSEAGAYYQQLAVDSGLQWAEMLPKVFNHTDSENPLSVLATLTLTQAYHFSLKRNGDNIS